MECPGKTQSLEDHIFQPDSTVRLQRSRQVLVSVGQSCSGMQQRPTQMWEDV